MKILRQGGTPKFAHSLVSFMDSWEYCKKTNQLNEELVSFLIAPFYAKGDSKEATDNNIRYFVDFNDPAVPER